MKPYMICSRGAALLKGVSGSSKQKKTISTVALIEMDEREETKNAVILW